MPFPQKTILASLLLSASLSGAHAAETTPADAPRAGIKLVGFPEAIQAPGEHQVAILHAEGAQIYDCKAGADGKLAWAFREPIATLLDNGKTAGRHYAGPTWELSDGSAVTGKVAGNAPGTTAADIPWLKLDVVSQRGTGTLTGVTTVQRILTQGGKLEGPCEPAGTYRSAPYSADYVFLRKG